MVCGLLIEVASRVAAHRLRNCGSRALEHRLCSCSTRAWLLRSMWNPPGPQIKPVSSELAGDSFPLHQGRPIYAYFITRDVYFIQSTQQTYKVSVIFFFHFTDIKTESQREEIAAAELARDVKIQSRV